MKKILIITVLLGSTIGIIANSQTVQDQIALLQHRIDLDTAQKSNDNAQIASYDLQINELNTEINTLQQDEASQNIEIQAAQGYIDILSNQQGNNTNGT